MKKIALILTVLFALAFGMNSHAQTAPDYFVGKWNATIYATPNGDAKMVLDLNRVDGKLTGTILSSPDQSEAIPLSELEERENSITVYFTVSGYQVSLTLDKKDEDHVTGSLMGMFNADGERIKEEVH